MDNVSKIDALLNEIEGCATAFISTQTNQEVKKGILLELKLKIKEIRKNLSKLSKN